MKLVKFKNGPALTAVSAAAQAEPNRDIFDKPSASDCERLPVTDGGRQRFAIFAVAVGASVLALAATTSSAHANMCGGSDHSIIGYITGPDSNMPATHRSADLGISVTQGGYTRSYFGDAYGDFYGAPADDVTSYAWNYYPGGQLPYNTWSPVSEPLTCSAMPYMGFGRTPMGVVSTSVDDYTGSIYVSYNNPYSYKTCDSSAECGLGLTCDTGLGLFDTPVLQALNGDEVCVKQGAYMATPTMCLGHPEAIPCFIVCADPPGKDGICVDQTSSMYTNTAIDRVRRTKAAVLTQIVAKDHVSYADNVLTNPVEWVTNKFINHAMLAVTHFDHGTPSNSDYSEPSSSGANVDILIWGRPSFAGANGSNKLYIAYQKNLDQNAWAPQYWTGSGWSANQSLAVPIDNGSLDITNQMSVMYSESLGKFIMLSGGNLPKNVLEGLYPYDGTAPAQAGSQSIYYQTATSPVGPWSAPIPLHDWSNETFPAKDHYSRAVDDMEAAAVTQFSSPYNCDGNGPVSPNCDGHVYSAQLVRGWSDKHPQSNYKYADIHYYASTWNPYNTVLAKARIYGGSGSPNVWADSFNNTSQFPFGFEFHGSETGNWTTSSGTYLRHTNGGTGQLWYGVMDVSDYKNWHSNDYQYRMKVKTNAAGGVGLVARWNGPNSHYLAYSTGTSLYLLENTNGRYTILDSTAWTRPTGWHYWTFEVDGHELSLKTSDCSSCSEQLRLQATDNSIRTGDAGVFGFGTEVRYNNMRITSCR